LEHHPEFATLWNACDVEFQPSPEDYFRESPSELKHPDVGLIHFYRISVPLVGSKYVLTMFSPAGAISTKKFEQLSSLRGA